MLKRLIDAIDAAECSCSVAERESGHKVGCWAPELNDALEALPEQRVIVCLCGSTRFMGAWQAANLSETLAGKIVLSIGCNTKSDADLQRLGELAADKKVELDALHLDKVDLADEVLVLNVGGYVGDSTRREVKRAKFRGKLIRWLEPNAIPEDLI